jgi:5-methylcytosine-specific restriction endonuclease McrA
MDRANETKKSLRKECDQLWKLAVVKKYGNKCLVCGKEAQDIHHFISKGKSVALRYDIDNGVPLCRKCHFDFHFRPDKLIDIVIAFKRGKEWIEALLERKKNRAKATKAWYLEQREKLVRFLKDDEDLTNTQEGAYNVKGSGRRPAS